MSAQIKQLIEQLQGFCGSATCYQIPMLRTKYTEGIKRYVTEVEASEIVLLGTKPE